jgi:pyruvate/2-oxoglutarate dehydrogenase complex dihydrolipoamide dehydrogenase (E3) component
MTSSQSYDVVVIGGGPVGENVIDRTARAGLSTLLVERELVGGECSYWACVPSKTLLRPGALLAQARGLPGVRDVVSGRPDPARTFERRDAMVSGWRDEGQLEWVRSVGVDFIRGSARFTGPRALQIERDGAEPVRVDVRHAVVVATGSEAVIPPIDGLAEARPWTSREATSARAVPPSLAVIGGGVVAVEMATAYAEFGSEVTLLVRGDRLLAAAEPFASEQVLASLRELGVSVELDVEITAAHRDGGAVEVAFLRSSQSSDKVTAAEVLVAAGRRPRTRDLGLDALGLPPGKPLEVDASMRVTAVGDGWLYAVGDVTGRTGTTHQGKYGARIAGTVLAERFGSAAGAGGYAARYGKQGAEPAAGALPVAIEPWSPYAATADLVGPPQVVFSRPEVASVGLTAAGAERDGLRVTAIDHDLAAVTGAYLKSDDYTGTARLVIDLDREVVVGATFTGPDAAELLHAATIAVVGEVPIRRLWHAVPAFPTVSEVWLRLLESYGL